MQCSAAAVRRPLSTAHCRRQQPSAGSTSSTASQRTQTGAADQRRPASRHFHCEPRPAERTDSDSSSGSGGAAETHNPSDPPPSTALSLHRHALESIFAFCAQEELAAALRVARDWLAAVRSMGRLQLSVADPTAPLRVVCQSAVGRHVGVLGSNEVRVQLNADSLFILTNHMGRLSELNCYLELPPRGQTLAFPAQLRRLTVDSSGSQSIAAQVKAVIVASLSCRCWRS